MNAHSIAWVLGETHMAEVSQQFRESVANNTTAGWWYILIPFVSIALACLIQFIFNRPVKVVNAPDGMLQELCRAHRIGSRNKLLLEIVAEEAELEHPGTLLVSPSLFDDAVEKAAARIKLDGRKEATLSELRRRFFGDEVIR